MNGRLLAFPVTFCTSGRTGPRRQPRKVVSATACVASLCGLLLISAGSGVAQEVSGLAAAAAIERLLVRSIAEAEKSVVAISVVPKGSGRSPRPGSPDFIPSQYATGVVIRRSGLVLTNYHVLHLDQKESEYDYYFTTAARTTYRARIKGADPRSDLAVLEPIDQGRPRTLTLTPIRLGDAKSLRKGQIVIALGNPYAIARDGQASASWGIIANLARKAGPVPDGSREGQGRPTLHHYGTLIQTDAKLNLGTSGGPLLNLKGEMIGLTTSLAALVGYEKSAGYAIPVGDMFRRAADALAKGREVQYGFLGIGTQDLQPAEVRGGLHGMRVSSVIRGTPAAAVGLMSGDVVTHVNGERIFDKDGLVLGVNRLRPRDSVRLTVRRRNQRLHFETRLTKYRVEGRRIITNRPPSWRGLRVDYPTAVLTIRAGENSIPAGCVAVSHVEKDTLAWKAGLRTGVLISHVGRTPVTTPEAFAAAVAGSKADVRLMRLQRGPLGATRQVELVVPASEG